MKRTLAFVFALTIAAAGLTAHAAELESGLKVGEQPGAFNVKDITGPNKGKSLCYRCNYGARPVVNVFAREVNEDLAKLIKQIDDVVAKNDDKKMAAFVVVLAEDADTIAPQLEEMANKNGIKNVPLTIFDGQSGPGDYNIAEQADVTVMMWNKSEVKANVALREGTTERHGDSDDYRQHRQDSQLVALVGGLFRSIIVHQHLTRSLAFDERVVVLLSVTFPDQLHGSLEG